jgi:serine protease Do
MSTRLLRTARSRRTGAAAFIATAALVAAACGGGSTKAQDTAAPSSKPDDSKAAAASTTLAATTTLPASRAGADGKLTMNDIQDSIIQISAAGSFRSVGESNKDAAGWSGSGFIVTEDGLAVTNNHVATGAAFLEVYVGGETEARPAKVIGVSECNDLALIDIDGGGFTPVTWFEGVAEPGQEVFLAGFPLGDPEPTLTRGIISKAKADGQTQWASVAHVLEHDANSQPGNSGGPLFTETGEVIGVHFMSYGAQSGTSQFFAIASDLAQPAVEEMKKNKDVLALGINAEAFVSEEAQLAGVWVQAVTDGSPAAAVGIKPGDIIQTLKGLPVGQDGTLSSFCKVLRSASEGAPISVEVIRFDTQEVLAGEFNGKELEQSFSFAAAADEETGSDTSAGEEVGQYTFERVTDDTGLVSVEVPVEYGARETAPLDIGDGVFLPGVLASTDAAAFNANGPPTVPGLFVGALDLLALGVPAGTALPAGTFDELLDNFGSDSASFCTPGERQDFDRGDVQGRYQAFLDCGQPGTTVFVVVASPPDTAYVVILLAVAQTDADLFAIDQAVSTFQVG